MQQGQRNGAGSRSEIRDFRLQTCRDHALQMGQDRVDEDFGVRPGFQRPGGQGKIEAVEVALSKDTVNGFAPQPSDDGRLDPRNCVGRQRLLAIEQKNRRAQIQKTADQHPRICRRIGQSRRFEATPRIGDQRLRRWRDPTHCASPSWAS